jgi:hypothetical protein
LLAFTLIFTRGVLGVLVVLFHLNVMVQVSVYRGDVPLLTQLLDLFVPVLPASVATASPPTGAVAGHVTNPESLPGLDAGIRPW